MDLVSRRFEAVKAMAAKAREEQESGHQLEALEARLDGSGPAGARSGDPGEAGSSTP
jgi:BMFP domain-containing protein YqiC